MLGFLGVLMATLLLGLIRALTLLYVVRVIFSLLPQMAYHTLARELNRFFEWMLRPIRGFFPPLQHVDLSGFVFLLLLLLAKTLIVAAYPMLS